MNFEVNAHDAPLSRLVFLRADGSTGTLDLHDDNALHDEDEVIKAKHLAAHAVTNGKIAPGAVTDNELAGHAVDRRHLSEELDTELANLKKSCDSISQSMPTLNGSIVTANTDKDGFITVTHSLGAAPRTVVITPASGQSDQLTHITKLHVYDINATTFRVRASRTDTNAWLTGNPVRFYWLGLK